MAAPPQTAAAQLGPESIHLWQIPRTLEAHRAPLLRLLAAYIGAQEEDVQLVDGAHGKPTLPEHLRRHPGGGILEFNWSHSGDQALVAIALGVQPGVDIERHVPRPNALAIARRFFAAPEAALLARIRDAERDAAFLELWCAKEAVLKAAGAGLSFGLDRLVFEREGACWRLASTDPALGGARAWQYISFAAAGGYHAALAWRGRTRNVLWLHPIDAAVA